MFYLCNSLISVYIGKNVATIDEQAFLGCSSLVNITVDEQNQHFESKGGALFDKGATTLYVYPIGIGESEYSIPDGVTTIHSLAFEGCTSLTSVKIPDSVTTIESRVFSGCSNLNTIEVSANNENFTSSKGVLFSKDEATLVQYPCGNSRKDYSIPNSVMSISSGAFSGCSNLVAVEIPDSVTTIESKTFEGCNSLKEVDIPKSVTRIEDYVFSGCTSLKKVAMHDSLENIGSNAFYGCSNLEEVSIPESVSYISSSAFEGCSSLKELVIPDSVTSISGDAFSGCSSLKFVSYLGKSDPGSYVDAFSSCDALAFVCVPPTYSSSSFCGKSAYSSANSESCESLSEEHNQCYEVTVYSRTSAVVNRRANATEWEDQTNGCVEYQCDNESGGLSFRKCHSGMVCVNDSECVKSGILDEWTVAIYMEPILAAEVNTTEVLDILSNLTEVDVDEMKIAIELDSKGKVVRILVYVKDEKTAKVVAEKVTGIVKDDDCKYGVLCRSLYATVIAQNLFLSEGSRVCG